MNNSKISIIIPVYNLEEYISYCLESVLNQTYPNFEIIIVNDGSSDSTGMICESYAEKDKRIRILYQKNKGLGAARNTGLENSLGDYITFIDGDDIIHPQYLEILYDGLQNFDADISVCNYEKGKLDIRFCKKRFLDYKTYEIEKPELINKMYNEHPFITVWAKLYSKSVITSKFPTRGIGEDVAFNSKTYLNARKVLYFDLPLYLWVIRNNSLSNSSFNNSELIKVKNFFNAWLNLKNEKQYSRYALKKLYKSFLSLRYDSIENYNPQVEVTIKYYKRLTIRHFYKDLPLFYSGLIHILLITPSLYRILRKSTERLKKCWL